MESMKVLRQHFPDGEGHDLWLGVVTMFLSEQQMQEVRISGAHVDSNDTSLMVSGMRLVGRCILRWEGQADNRSPGVKMSISMIDVFEYHPCP